MKLEVGMYVRTKKRTLQCPQIARIRNISKDTGYKNQYYIELDKNLIPSYEYHIYKEDILKASHNIIDLIEENDYIRIVTSAFYEPVYYSYGKLVIRDDIDISKYTNKFIAEVITHEQMESMSYKIERG